MLRCHVETVREVLMYCSDAQDAAGSFSYPNLCVGYKLFLLRRLLLLEMKSNTTALFSPPPTHPPHPSAEDLLADLPEDVTLELVWKNNERLKEYVLVSSKELDYEEDPGSLSETARAGHFTLEQCLNLFTKPEVLAPEEAW